jgi:hypothetical protein
MTMTEKLKQLQPPFALYVSHIAHRCNVCGELIPPRYDFIKEENDDPAMTRNLCKKCWSKENEQK